MNQIPSLMEDREFGDEVETMQEREKHRYKIQEQRKRIEETNQD